MREWEGVSFNPVSTWSLSRLCCWLAPTLCKLPATHNMRGFRGSRAQLLQYGLEMHSAQHRTHGTLHHWEHLGMLGYATGLSTIPEGGICWMEGSGGLQPHTRQTATQAGREEKPRPAERPAGPRRAFTTAQGLVWAAGAAEAAAPDQWVGQGHFGKRRRVPLLACPGSYGTGTVGPRVPLCGQPSPSEPPLQHP